MSSGRVRVRRPADAARFLVLGIIGVVLATLGAITFGKYGPAWYSLAIIAVSLPWAWAGARLARPRARAGR